MVKLTDRCFCSFTAAMLVALGRAPTWRFHTKFYKFGWSTFPNNARMKNRTELNLGKVFYVWLIYHIQDSWLNSLNGYEIYIWLRDTANQPLWQEWVFRITFDQKENRMLYDFYTAYYDDFRRCSLSVPWYFEMQNLIPALSFQPFFWEII